MKLSNKVYDVLKYICLIVSPALITLITTIFTLYHIPNVEVVTGTIAAVTTFIGALIGVSCINYNKGDK
jgi:chromate transport protein ChrA